MKQKAHKQNPTPNKYFLQKFIKQARTITLAITQKRASDNQTREQAKNQQPLTTHQKKNVSFLRQPIRSREFF